MFGPFSSYRIRFKSNQTEAQFEQAFRVFLKEIEIKDTNYFDSSTKKYRGIIEPEKRQFYFESNIVGFGKDSSLVQTSGTYQSIENRGILIEFKTKPKTAILASIFIVFAVLSYRNIPFAFVISLLFYWIAIYLPLHYTGKRMVNDFSSNFRQAEENQIRK